MNDYYIFYRNRENINKLKIEHIEAETIEKAKSKFIKRYGYDMNQAFSFMSIVISDIKDAYEYNQYLQVEYTKESETKNSKKWINKLNELLNNEIESFKIKTIDYMAFMHTVEQNGFIGKIAIINQADKKTKRYIIMSEERVVQNYL